MDEEEIDLIVEDIEAKHVESQNESGSDNEDDICIDTDDDINKTLHYLGGSEHPEDVDYFVKLLLQDSDIDKALAIYHEDLNKLDDYERVCNFLQYGIQCPPKCRTVTSAKETPESERITSDFLYLTEYTELISARIQQIENGSPIYIDDEISKHLTDVRDIAIRELHMRRFPLMLKRRVNERQIEYWDPNKMAFPFNI